MKKRTVCRQLTVTLALAFLGLSGSYFFASSAQAQEDSMPASPEQYEQWLKKNGFGAQLAQADAPKPPPVSNTLFAGRPATNCAVFRSMIFFCSSMPRRSFSAIRCGWATACNLPPLALRRQRKAVALSHSGGVGSAGASNCSKRASTASARCNKAVSASVFGIDFDVIVREVAGPNRGRGLAAIQNHSGGDFRSLHFSFTLGLFIAFGASAVFGD